MVDTTTEAIALLAFVATIAFLLMWVWPLAQHRLRSGWASTSIRDEVDAIMLEQGDEPISLDTLINRVQERIERDPTNSEVPDQLIRAVISDMVDDEELSWRTDNRPGHSSNVIVSRPRLSYVA